MNVVMVIPTGIGCTIGGHAGDATPAARLLGACCDKLILHPNVVNASDINEMPENALYVEGSILDRFLEGQIQLQEVKSNRILLAANSPVRNETINAVSAARATLGADIRIVELKTPLRMIASFAENGAATGHVAGWRQLINQVRDYDFDALAIASTIEVPEAICVQYYRSGGVNPWGGVEAKASKLIASELNKPVAHAPIESSTEQIQDEIFHSLVPPAIAAEAVSNCYLHCVLKGLHRAPRIGQGLSVEDVDCLVTPFQCVGRPHRACLAKGIPVIAVHENETVLRDEMPDAFILADTYLEAAGLLMAIRAGVTRESLTRPLSPTCVHKIGEPVY